jgi:hypothetical protein
MKPARSLTNYPRDGQISSGFRLVEEQAEKPPAVTASVVAQEAGQAGEQQRGDRPSGEDMDP